MSPTEAAARAANEDAFFSATLAQADPEIADVIAQGTRSPARRDRADRVGEHRQPRGARGAGLGADQQIRRGLSGPALLRRLPVRRHGRDARDRARQEAVRRELRQRAAEFRQPDEPGGVPRAGEAGRHLHGARSRGRRPPDPRLAGQHLGQVVQGGALHGAARGPDHRHGRGRAHRARERSRRSSSRAAAPIRASGTSSASARSPTRSGRS